MHAEFKLMTITHQYTLISPESYPEKSSLNMRIFSYVQYHWSIQGYPYKMDPAAVLAPSRDLSQSAAPTLRLIKFDPMPLALPQHAGGQAPALRRRTVGHCPLTSRNGETVAGGANSQEATIEVRRSALLLHTSTPLRSSFEKYRWA